MSHDEPNPIYTRLAIETGITEVQNSFCRCACGTDEVSQSIRNWPAVGGVTGEPK
jgi:hypothetical protein